MVWTITKWHLEETKRLTGKWIRLFSTIFSFLWTNHWENVVFNQIIRTLTICLPAPTVNTSCLEDSDFSFYWCPGVHAFVILKYILYDNIYEIIPRLTTGAILSRRCWSLLCFCFTHCGSPHFVLWIKSEIS